MSGCIVIPSRSTSSNTRWLLRQCLTSIAQHEPTLLTHTYIIDDASVGDTNEFYAQFLTTFGVNLLLKRKHENYSAVVNLAFKHLEEKYDWILTLNNDTEIKVPFASFAEQLFERFPRLAVIGAKLYYPTGRIQHAGITIPAINQWQPHDLKEFEPNAITANDPRFIMAVTGAFQIIRSKALKEIGHYSPKYEMAYEDMEFCLRTWSKGYQVVYYPGIYAVHHESATRGHRTTPAEVNSFKQFEEDYAKFDIRNIFDSIAEANRTKDNS